MSVEQMLAEAAAVDAGFAESEKLLSRYWSISRLSWSAGADGGVGAASAPTRPST
jgi:hypothetical protein